MKCFILLIILATCNAKPTDSPSSTVRSPIGDTIKKLSEQLIDQNSTSQMVFDTRTPPKIKQHVKKKNKPQDVFENSHAGVAIPVDDESLIIEETTKKMNFYKLDKPTTNSGLSTWILLSGSTTSKPPQPSKTIAPTRKNSTTTTVYRKKTTSTTPKTTTTEAVAATTTKLIKIKASVLNNAKKNQTTVTPTTTEATVQMKNTTEDASRLPMEAKTEETDLNEKQSKRPTQKRKKNNKNRRRKPDKTENNNDTKIEKPHKPSKEKPLGTQLYNYLSREIMPTVGVGLVGLMVTAGLASYFLYPFGIARRSYDIDRRDREGQYYYNDYYSGGIAEEEAIGKVIAGMTSTFGGINPKTPTSRIGYSPTYNRPAYESKPEYSSNEPVTPIVVPEHGPRNLKIRKRDLSQTDDELNEIDSESLDKTDSTTVESITTTDNPTTILPITTTTLSPSVDRISSFFKVMTDLFHLKINLGLQLLQNATDSFSRYVSKVQKRFDEHYFTNSTS